MLTNKKLPLLELHCFKYLICVSFCLVIFLGLTAFYVTFAYKKIRHLLVDFDITKTIDVITGVIDTLFPSEGKCSYNITSSSGKLDQKESICDVNTIQLYHFSIYILALYHMLGCALIACNIVFGPLVLCNQKLRG